MHINWKYNFSCTCANLRPIFGRLPEPNTAWLLVVYFSRQASQLSVYQSRDYNVYIKHLSDMPC